MALFHPKKQNETKLNEKGKATVQSVSLSFVFLGWNMPLPICSPSYFATDTLVKVDSINMSPPKCEENLKEIIFIMESPEIIEISNNKIEDFHAYFNSIFREIYHKNNLNFGVFQLVEDGSLNRILPFVHENDVIRRKMVVKYGVDDWIGMLSVAFLKNSIGYDGGYVARDVEGTLQDVVVQIEKHGNKKSISHVVLVLTGLRNSPFFLNSFGKSGARQKNYREPVDGRMFERPIIACNKLP